jgi:hypothetical protein
MESLSDNIKYEICGCFKGTYVKGTCRHCLSGKFWEAKHTYFFIQKYLPHTIRAIYTKLDIE